MLALLLVSCATTPTPVPDAPKPAPVKAAEETHFGELTQLTFGGENAEAYWSLDGTRLSFQAHSSEQGCDRIYTMRVFDDPGGEAENGTG